MNKKKKQSDDFQLAGLLHNHLPIHFKVRVCVTRAVFFHQTAHDSTHALTIKTLCEPKASVRMD